MDSVSHHGYSATLGHMIEQPTIVDLTTNLYPHNASDNPHENSNLRQHAKMGVEHRSCERLVDDKGALY